MITIRAAAVGLLTGLLLSVGWLVFIDAQVNVFDPFPWVHILPPLCATAAAIGINLVSVNDVAASTAIKVWLFWWFSVSCACIGFAIWILVREYAPPRYNYPGVGILIQTVLAMFAGFLFFVGRHPIAQDTGYY